MRSAKRSSAMSFAPFQSDRHVIPAVYPAGARPGVRINPYLGGQEWPD
jgi:hypothetical protein